jgi:hypothetical protein
VNARRAPPPTGTGPVAGYIASWRPSSVSPRAAAFARDVIAAVALAGRERAKNLLWAAGKLADYAASLGLELVPEVDTARSGVSRELHPAATALGNHPDAAHEQERLLGYNLSTR